MFRPIPTPSSRLGLCKIFVLTANISNVVIFFFFLGGGFKVKRHLQNAVTKKNGKTYSRTVNLVYTPPRKKTRHKRQRHTLVFQMEFDTMGYIVGYTI